MIKIPSKPEYTCPKCGNTIMDHVTVDPVFNVFMVVCTQCFNIIDQYRDDV